MQVHCVRSNATQGNTSVYFKQASKNVSTFIKKCSVYFKIVVCYENGQSVKKKLGAENMTNMRSDYL